MDTLERVRRELAAYEHPFFDFSAGIAGAAVEIRVEARVAGVHSPEYRFTLTEREIDHPQFRWTFQKLLYGNLNDYMVELFTRLPGD